MPQVVRSLRAAIIGSLALFLLALAALNINSLPLIGEPSTGYQAEFVDAGGLKTGDPVEVSGIRAGAVDRIEIKHAMVVVHFQLRTTIRLGRATTSAIKIGSLLGAKFLDVEPAGQGRMTADATIPLARTVPAYDIVAAFSDLTNTTEQIDKQAVATALDTIANTFRDATPAIHDAFDGLSRFAGIISDRNQEVRDLLARAQATTGLLAQRRGDLVTLMRSSTALLSELQSRRDSIQRLLTTTSALFDQLRGLVSDNQAALNPALTHLNSVISVLAKRQSELKDLLRNMDLFTRVFVNTTGSGPWFDSVVPNLPTHATVGAAQ